MESNPFILSAWSLLPPFLVIVLAITTRRVLLSLGLGILLSVLFIEQFQPLASAQHLFNEVISLFWKDDQLNDWSFNILIFLLLIGCIISMLGRSGATLAFAEWAQTKIKSRRQAKAITGLLVFLFFIDDYFHSLSAGAICRPVTDRFNISRAKLAYLLDSTAAPVCVLMPVSSWGAYIIAVLGGLLITHELTDHTPLMVFISMGSMNFYAIFTLLMVVFVIRGNWDLGPMRTHEQNALNGQLYDASKGVPPGVIEHDEHKGKVSHLLLAIFTLTVVSIGCLFWTGHQNLTAQQLEFSILGALEHTDVGLSLVLGGLSSMLVCSVFLIQKRVPLSGWWYTLSAGIKGMLPAIYILLLAWMTASLIGQLETGKYLASLVQQNIPLYLLPTLLFVLAGIMALSTGTSWGTFGIMLPLAADMTMAIDTTMLMPGLAAVMAGAVFGDHCSPISDTTILSSTGASCHHIDHVITQLPYALSIALVSIVGFLMLGITGNLLLAFIAAGICFAVVLGAWAVLSDTKLESILAE